MTDPRDTGEGRPVKVSVVVPVHDPGRDIDRCIESLLGQSLRPDAFEAIFVDDGSTDDTPARLDALAAAHPNIRVIHIPNSGWPGRPRNIGIDHARGEYLQLLDQDDHLGREALERLYDMGQRNGSDIVIGKVTSDFRDVPFELFARDRESCTFADAPIVTSMTAHKLFRVAFLREQELRFPEGRFVLEDHFLMVRAYDRAETISVMASYPCYFYMERRDGINTGSAPIDPPEYFAQMGKVIERIRTDTAPGVVRDQLLARYQGEMLGWLGDQRFVDQPPSVRASLVESVRALDGAQFAGRSDADLRPALRLRSELLRAGRTDALLDLAGRTGALVARCRLLGAASRDGRLRLAMEAWLTHGPDGPPLVLLRRDDRYRLDPSLSDGILAEPVDVTDHLASFRARASVRAERDSVEWKLPTKAVTRFDETGASVDGWAVVRPTLSVEVTVDPSKAAAGGPLVGGRWGLDLRVSGLGFERRIAVGDDRAAGVETGSAQVLFGDPVRSFRPLFAPTGLAFDVDDRPDLSVLSRMRRSAVALARGAARGLPRGVRARLRRRAN